MQWEFTKGVLKEEGHDQICVLEGQFVGRIENQYWKQGNQLASWCKNSRNHNGQVFLVMVITNACENV